MSRDASITFDWADDTHTFRLPLGQLRELQEKTDAGPLSLLRRLQGGTWRVDDAREVIRLGLIGGGMKPEDALTLTRRYVDPPCPMLASVNTAVLILGAAVLGVDDEPLPGKDRTAEATTGSASPSSTDMEPSSDGHPDRSTP